MLASVIENFKPDALLLDWASGQNIDRLVSLDKACRKTKRQLVLDAYTHHILRATGKPENCALNQGAP